MRPNGEVIRFCQSSAKCLPLISHGGVAEIDVGFKSFAII
jgi:hypothetical protein